MKKVLFGIFAHPDDEAFGPSGTLIKEAQSGTDVHLMCVTNGGAGRNDDGVADLMACRMEEWRHASELIGVQTTKALGYADGSLCNNVYHEIAEAIETHVRQTCKKYDQPIEINFMAHDTSGITGHIDHVAVSLIATFVFLRFKREETSWHMGQLRYFCLPYTKKLVHDTHFVYMPPGRRPKECDETVNVSDVFDQKLAVMRAHHSQRADLAWIENNFGPSLKTERFCYLD